MKIKTRLSITMFAVLSMLVTLVSACENAGNSHSRFVQDFDYIVFGDTHSEDPPIVTKWISSLRIGISVKALDREKIEVELKKLSSATGLEIVTEYNSLNKVNVFVGEMSLVELKKLQADKIDSAGWSRIGEKGFDCGEIVFINDKGEVTKSSIIILEGATAAAKERCFVKGMISILTPSNNLLWVKGDISHKTGVSGTGATVTEFDQKVLSILYDDLINIGATRNEVLEVLRTNCGSLFAC